MTNQQVFDTSKECLHALQGLETAALEPINPIEIAAYCGILTARVGAFVNLCLSQVAKELTVDDL